jgi:hypothetical protein
VAIWQECPLYRTFKNFFSIYLEDDKKEILGICSEFFGRKFGHLTTVQAPIFTFKFEFIWKLTGKLEREGETANYISRQTD